MRFENAIIQPPVLPKMHDPHEDFPFLLAVNRGNPGKVFTLGVFPLLTTLIKKKKTKLLPS